MKPQAVVVKYGKSELIAVPAEHCNHIFAAQVNALCTHPASRPEAIAVELGPHSAAAAARWLKELEAAAALGGKLPIMLGLTRRNPVIHSAYRERAFQLQRDTGKDLSELPPEVLHRELDYAACALLPLSPTDSIVEAVRCAVELNVPLYGVDLDDKASVTHEAIIIEDPGGAPGGFAGYIARTAPAADGHRDEATDGRRETVMAARLKDLLSRCGRVLFTCGMAHWVNIVRRLKDETLRPAFLGEPLEVVPDELKRVVVHPLIAVRHTDLFPALAQAYEALRRPPQEGGLGTDVGKVLKPLAIFEDRIQKAYLGYFRGGKQGWRRGKRAQDLERLHEFEAYLANSCLIGQRRVPDLSLTLTAAQEMMSRAFVDLLTRRLMRIRWASPEDFPGCALLAPSAQSRGEVIRAAYVEGAMEDPRDFFLKPMIGRSSSGEHPILRFEWKKARRGHRCGYGGGLLHSWLPWDNLISLMSHRATTTAMRRKPVKTTELFAGSMLEGIDWKATARSQAAGKDDVHVRDTAKRTTSSELQPGEVFPVVWILASGEHTEADWTVLFEDCNWMSEHVNHQERLQALKRKRGDKMISIIAYGETEVKGKAVKGKLGIRLDHYSGLLIYNPICWTKRQMAVWAERTGYRRNPYCRDNTLGGVHPSDLERQFKEEHGVRLHEFDWKTTLMLLGLAFAGETLTVVVPAGLVINPVVFRRAKKRHTEICRVSLESFPGWQRKKLSLSYMAPTTTYQPRPVFSRAVEEAIGESQKALEELLPKSLMGFGKAFNE